METLDQAKAAVAREKPRRMYRSLRDEAALRPGTHNDRRRLLYIAARALTLLEMDEEELREALRSE
jgi:hypothetical protein